MAKIYTSVFIVYICFGRATGIVNIDPEKKEKIDNFANSLLFDCDKHSNIVGMNLAVVYEGEILYTTGYGVKNLGRSKYFLVVPQMFVMNRPKTNDAMMINNVI